MDGWEGGGCVECRRDDQQQRTWDTKYKTQKTKKHKQTGLATLRGPADWHPYIEITFHNKTNTNKQVNDTVTLFPSLRPRPGFFTAASPAFFRVAVVFFAAFFTGVFFAAAALAFVVELVPVTA